MIFCIKDYRGNEVIFTRKKLEQKIIDHPELGKKTFMDCVKRAIKNPDEVWEDYSDKVKNQKNKRCYYKKYSIYSYAKVVVWVTSEPCEIVSAYEINKIKERKYPNLKQFV